MDPLLVVVALITVALVFDFINGFHDAANSIATVVSTRVLSPGKAVVWAAFFNFVAAFGFGTAVAKTIGLQSLLATLGVHAVIAMLNLQYRGVRRVWWFALVVLALAVAALAFIGGLRVWGWLEAAWARLPGR